MAHHDPNLILSEKVDNFDGMCVPDINNVFLLFGESDTVLTMLCACLVAELGKLHFLRHIDSSNN